MSRVLDVTAGTRSMWFNKNNHEATFCDIRQETHITSDGRVLEVKPDVVADFRSLPFSDESYHLVVFDPPHLKSLGWNSWMAKKYGVLFGTWEHDIRQGFDECWRVLKPNGTLIFKWNEFEVPISKVLSLIPKSPLFGHTFGKNGKTIWMTFIK